jgi:cytochrome c biogenesis protein CcmG/thiol:disulfide interchange protein DsbE
VSARNRARGQAPAVPPRWGSRWAALGGIVVAVGSIALLLGFGLTHDPNAVPSTLVGKPAPAFNLATIDGSQRIQLAALRGQVVIVNFWASWCVACQTEQPALEDAFNRYRDRGMVLVGISFQDSATDARAYASRNGIPWPLLSDPESSTGLAYGVTGLPETYFIGPDGRVGHKQVGLVTTPLINSEVRRLQPQAVG